MNQSEGRHEIEAARKRLSAAKEQVSSTAKNADSARAMLEQARAVMEASTQNLQHAQSMNDAAKNEACDAEKRLKEAEGDGRSLMSTLRWKILGGMVVKMKIARRSAKCQCHLELKETITTATPS